MDSSSLKNPLKQIVSESQLSDFLINLSHEFRTPLAVILLELEQLSAQKKDTGYKPEYQESISHIKKNSLRIAKAVNNLIDIISSGQGGLSPQVTSFNAIKTIRDITGAVRHIIRAKHLLFDNRPGGRELFITADEGMFEKAFLNLLSNALKHSKKEGPIYVVLDSDGADMTVSVRDEGGGIKKSMEEDIFNRLLPGGLDMSKDSEGLGVGLSLVKAIADAHHGRVWFKNEPGRGSTFFFSLPIESTIKKGGFIAEMPLSFSERVQMELSDLQ